jgi:hypothetical protein
LADNHHNIIRRTEDNNDEKQKMMRRALISMISSTGRVAGHHAIQTKNHTSEQRKRPIQQQPSIEPTRKTDFIMGVMEKIKEIEAEMARTQKNKATSYHLGEFCLVVYGRWLLAVSFVFHSFIHRWLTFLRENKM